MKKITLLLFINASLSAQTVFINEIHYDNIGGDVNEAIEIAGPAGTDLSMYSLVLYNGNGGGVDKTEVLSGLIPNQQDGFGTLNFPIVGIQNGPPDGIALYNGISVVQFLSYEGVFVAVGGVAGGMTSTDIGVSESNSTTGTSESLQLSGTGTTYSNFIWEAPATATPASINNEQIFDSTVLNNPEYIALKNKTVLFPNPTSIGKLTLQTPINSQIEIIIYTSIGVEVSKQMVKNSQAISTTNLAEGVYFAQLTFNGNTTTKRIVIQ